MKTRIVPLRLVATGISLIGLVSACAPTHLALHPEATGTDGTGVVRSGFVQPHRIEVTLEGQLYTGDWRTQDAPDHPLAHSYLHRHTVGRVITTLTNNNGKRLSCNWLVDGQRGSGTCEDDDHNKYAVTIG